MKPNLSVLLAMPVQPAHSQLPLPAARQQPRRMPARELPVWQPWPAGPMHRVPWIPTGRNG